MPAEVPVEQQETAEEKRYRVMRFSTEVYDVRARSPEEAKRRLADPPDSRQDVTFLDSDREVDVTELS